MSIQRDFKTGEIGENITLSLLKNDKSISEIRDVRKDKKYQKRDIDFIIKKDNKDIKLEVKTDARACSTGNIVYETYSNTKYNTVGCFDKTRANYILYYVLYTNVLYIIDINKFRLRIYSHKAGELVERQMGDHAKGYVFSLNELEQHDFMERVELDFRIERK